MNLSITVFGDIAEIKISGCSDEFDQGLAWVKKTFAKEDRQFVDFKRVWAIRDVKKYLHVPEVAAAVERAKSQPSLF